MNSLGCLELPYFRALLQLPHDREICPPETPNQRDTCVAARGDGGASQSAVRAPAGGEAGSRSRETCLRKSEKEEIRNRRQGKDLTALMVMSRKRESGQASDG